MLKNFLPGEDPAALDNETPLVTGGILDSIRTLKLVSFLEEQYDIELEPHELDRDYLETIPLIAQLAETKLKAS